MAADGSITIDTGLDNSGFAKDSKELIQAIKDLTTQITGLGKTIQSTFKAYTQTVQTAVGSTSAVESQMETASESADQLADSASGVKDALEGVKIYENGEVVNFDEEIDGAQQLTEAVEETQDALANTKFYYMGEEIDMSAMDEEVDDAADHVEHLQEELETVNETANQAAQEAAQPAAQAVQEAAEPAEETVGWVDQIKDGYAQIKEQMARVKQTILDKGQKFSPIDVQETEQEIARIENQLNRLYERQAKMQSRGQTGSAAFANVTADIQDAENELASFKNDLEELNRHMLSMKVPPISAEIQKSATFTDLLKAKVQQMGTKLYTMGASAITTASNISNAFHHPIQTLNAGLGKVCIKAGEAFRGLKQAASSAIQAGFKKIGSAAKSAAKSLANMVKGGVISGVKKLASNLFRVGAGAKSSSGGLKMGLKSMMKYGLGVRSVFALLNKLRRAMMEGMGNYAKFDPGFNAAVSQFVAALMQLRNAFVSAFAPVIEVVLPILTTLINAITETVNRIGMLISSLTGKNSFKKATKVQYDYAEAMNDSADATDDETEAAKEAQKQLAGFDDVEILKEDKDSGSKGNKGGQDMGGFTDVPIENSMSDLAKKLKEAWEKADFTEIGRMVGEKLRDALENIPWPKIKKTLQKIAKCIATFLNGFLETPGLFSVIGKTIAEGINSAFEFVNSFVQNFHWDSLGYAVRDGLVGVFNNLDWGLIQTTFIGIGTGLGTALSAAFDNPEVWNGAFLTLTNGLNSLIYGIDAFLKSVDWFSLAANIATGLNTGLVNMDWTALGTTCAGVVNSLFNLFNGFVSTTDWGLLGASIMETIGAFFGSIEWGNVGEALSNTWIALFDFLSGALQEVDWEALPGDICNAIGEFLAGFDWSGFCESLGGLLGSAFSALVQLGTGLWNTLLDFGKSVIEGGWQGMCDKIAGVGRWIKENILDPFIKGFKDAFGIHSPSKVMMPLGENIIEGMLQGIKDIWHIITDFFEGCGQTISNVWDGLTSWWEGIGDNLVTGIWNGICDSWDWLCDSVGSLCSNLWNGFCDFWGINSPSRLMMEGGRYIGEGAAVGLERTTNDNVHAIQNLGQAMHQEAEKIEPISLQAGVQDSLSGLDNVLLNFSDKVVNAFDGMIAQLDALVSSPGFGVPAFAAGTIAPYGTGTSRRSSLEDALENFTANNDALTKDDLTAALSPVIEAIKNYAGTHLSDEAVARSANRGNERLGRRFQTKDK